MLKTVLGQSPLPRIKMREHRRNGNCADLYVQNFQEILCPIFGEKLARNFSRNLPCHLRDKKKSI
jgi:hypothetical protein